MNIPVEAIEAAARRLCLLAGYDWDNMDAPEDVVADFKSQLTEQAESILEAAAPHIAGAWHDAVSEAYVEGALSADQANAMWAKSPYRRPE